MIARSDGFCVLKSLGEMGRAGDSCAIVEADNGGVEYWALSNPTRVMCSALCVEDAAAAADVSDEMTLDNGGLEQIKLPASSGGFCWLTRVEGNMDKSYSECRVWREPNGVWKLQQNAYFSSDTNACGARCLSGDHFAPPTDESVANDAADEAVLGTFSEQRVCFLSGVNTVGNPQEYCDLSAVAAAPSPLWSLRAYGDESKCGARCLPLPTPAPSAVPTSAAATAAPTTKAPTAPEFVAPPLNDDKTEVAVEGLGINNFPPDLSVWFWVQDIVFLVLYALLSVRLALEIARNAQDRSVNQHTSPASESGGGSLLPPSVRRLCCQLGGMVGSTKGAVSAFVLAGCVLRLAYIALVDLASSEYTLTLTHATHTHTHTHTHTKSTHEKHIQKPRLTDAIISLACRLVPARAGVHPPCHQRDRLVRRLLVHSDVLDRAAGHDAAEHRLRDRAALAPDGFHRRFRRTAHGALRVRDCAAQDGVPSLQGALLPLSRRVGRGGPVLGGSPLPLSRSELHEENAELQAQRLQGTYGWAAWDACSAGAAALHALHDG